MQEEAIHRTDKLISRRNWQKIQTNLLGEIGRRFRPISRRNWQSRVRITHLDQSARTPVSTGVVPIIQFMRRQRGVEESARCGVEVLAARLFWYRRRQVAWLNFSGSLQQSMSFGLSRSKHTLTCQNHSTQANSGTNPAQGLI